MKMYSPINCTKAFQFLPGNIYAIFKPLIPRLKSNKLDDFTVPPVYYIMFNSIAAVLNTLRSIKSTAQGMLFVLKEKDAIMRKAVAKSKRLQLFSTFKKRRKDL